MVRVAQRGLEISLLHFGNSAPFRNPSVLQHLFPRRALRARDRRYDADEAVTETAAAASRAVVAVACGGGTAVRRRELAATAAKERLQTTTTTPRSGHATAPVWRHFYLVVRVAPRVVAAASDGGWGTAARAALGRQRRPRGEVPENCGARQRCMMSTEGARYVRTRRASGGLVRSDGTSVVVNEAQAGFCLLRFESRRQWCPSIGDRQVDPIKTRHFGLSNGTSWMSGRPVLGRPPGAVKCLYSHAPAGGGSTCLLPPGAGIGSNRRPLPPQCC